MHETDFDLNALIDGLSAMFKIRCEQKGIKWANEQMGKWANGERILVHGDEGKLRQVLINLLGNAVKFTDEGGVTLRVDQTQTENHASQPAPIHRGFTFHVIDTGVGISPEDQMKIFDPFYQGEAGMKKGGTGLGLAISQRHIELMGGELELESPAPQPPNFGL